MKKLYIITLLFSLSMLSSCDKSISDPVREAYVPVKVDENAGSWKTYILTSPTDITVAEPSDINSLTYQNEVIALKTAQANLTSDNKASIAYWGSGAVYRWNEIARELAARHNLPPVAKADGTYPIPDASNPLAEPTFPFANPPYTARALAYLSVAQYDALVSTWYYKYKYNRSAPFKRYASINAFLPSTDMPSYPSEAAVVGAASYTILAAMFPGDIPYLQAKLAECENACTWAGMNVASDVSAGDALGKSVAAKVMARAKTDGMGAANDQTVTAAKIANAQSIGVKQPWVSQESPARPPMLPNYGAVKLWNLGSTTLASIRPVMPYIVGSTAWQKDLDELTAIQTSQTREQARIANYWADGVGSYTPPGHWHREAANLCFDNKFSEVAMARTMALVGTALMDAGIACWETKYYYYTPRPQQFSLKTSIGLPNFPSYTSGHSTFSAAAATVLGSLFPAKATEMTAKAQESSDSRVYGMIHYRVDCEMGLVHGRKIGEYAIARGKSDGSGY